MEVVKDPCPILPNTRRKKIYSLRNLRKSLKFRPQIYRIILKMRLIIIQKSKEIKKLKHKNKQVTMDEKSIQTELFETENSNNVINDEEAKESVKDCKIMDDKKPTSPGWTISENGEKSIAEQVKEAAQSAIEESGMVYVESAGMYYDYKTGYYYSPELGLYYHNDTGCYYYFNNDSKTFLFHSYADKSQQETSAPLKPKRKAKKHKETSTPDDVDNLTESLSQDEKIKRKRRKITKQAQETSKDKTEENDVKDNKDTSNDIREESEHKDVEIKEELEDGECSESEGDSSDAETDVSTSTASDDESVSKHHPPCMRIIVRETNLPKLKVGSLYLITKDGGTIGREGEQHALVVKDHNVSRSHLDIKYDMERGAYFAVDVGSKNGTVLNGVRMSESCVRSQPIEVVHGSVLQLGETRLLCHVHAGSDTCGHCEPGLIMDTQEKEKKVAYTRTCSVQKQHQLELARLRNKYAPQPKAIEEKAYNDRAQARREQVGSSHVAEKTQTSDIDTCIAAENKGFKLLEKMGWSKGEGLGKDNQGDTEPIPLISNEGKAGLGAAPVPAATAKASRTLGPATMRLAAKTKMLRPPAKAFQQPVDQDSD